ncbi:PD-(D/E)XK nuclease family protein [Sunxiuqinia rutila]|uniref:PDDEXK-like family protein n=1 Tax=Sunxiuqinia rutila TaxID=1397841 RepID=UPI003D35E122
MNHEKTNHLLQQAGILIKHQREKEILKGESFNVFSILKMETKENETHSAFLAELLNPDGSHLKGNTFLNLFLQTIDNKTIDLQSAKVKVEHAVGTRDDNNKTGGRIDLYIWDSQGNTISIENKIYAGDQQAQVERYVNHNKEKNTVYYLTLDGHEPSKNSKGKLVVDEDFFTLSYKGDIINWLQMCFQESADVPILRESIKQYMILLKKLTHTMENKEQQELINLILSNYEEASLIANNINKAATGVRDRWRNKVIELLEEQISDNYQISRGDLIHRKFAQIWIKPIGFADRILHFGVESFSGNGIPDSRLFIGVVNLHATPKVRDPYWDNEQNTPRSNWWTNVYYFEDIEGLKMDSNDPKTIRELANEDTLNKVSEALVDQILDYLDQETKPLLAYFQKAN